ncbi:hypothetical protein T07_12537 [Trichinella nelsoni]|uniref:Uncharacterized protein n=1 Tax=Trichinella nelsoni TaxID=6336 RepID=A0A0V0RAI2_9BILA|nr:hypothetical protein T07_12537 [Trichinella nelsoni]
MSHWFSCNYYPFNSRNENFPFFNPKNYKRIVIVLYIIK